MQGEKALLNWTCRYTNAHNYAEHEPLFDGMPLCATAAFQSPRPPASRIDGVCVCVHAHPQTQEGTNMRACVHACACMLACVLACVRVGGHVHGLNPKP